MTSPAFLTTADAELFIDAARDAASDAGVTVSISMFDRGGSLLAFVHDDGQCSFPVRPAPGRRTQPCS